MARTGAAATCCCTRRMLGSQDRPRQRLIEHLASCSKAALINNAGSEARRAGDDHEHTNMLPACSPHTPDQTMTNGAAQHKIHSF